MTTPPTTPSTPSLPPPAPPPGPPPSGPTGRRVPMPPSTPASRFNFQHEAANLPPRFVLTAVEGWGKSTLAGYAPDPLFILPPREDGAARLMALGQIPSAPHIEVDSYTLLRDLLTAMANGDPSIPPHRTLVLDGMASFEELHARHIADTKYGGDLGENGYGSYMRGCKDMRPLFADTIALLDKIWRKHNRQIILLAHTQIRAFKNPEGPDFDIYVTDLDDKVLAAINRWVDDILFGRFVPVVKTDKKGGNRAKAIGHDDRILQAVRSDVAHVKNKHGIPAQLEMPEDPAQMYAALAAYTKFV